MATVKKMREGVFLISWTCCCPTYYGRSFDADVNIDEISQSVRLFFGKTATNYTSSLVMEISQPTATDKNLQFLKPESILAIKNGEHQSMQWINSVWTTQFSEYCQCSRETHSSNFDILIDFNLTSIKPESKHVLDHLLNLWETKTLADVTFKFNKSFLDKDVQAHTLIIASGSPVLAAMFQHDFKEKQERIVLIKDVRSTVFEKMLKFIYTGDADLDNVDVSDLLIVANKYGVDSLKEKCAEFMTENLTVDNVIHYLVVSHLHEAPKLYKTTLEFISQNALAIVSRRDWMDLMKNDHELSLAAVQLMVLTLSKPNQ